MIDVKDNFKSSEANLTCRKCCKEKETQEHLLSCEALLDLNPVVSTPSYEDILGLDTEKISRTGRILTNKYDLFKKPCAPMTSAATAVL